MEKGTDADARRIVTTHQAIEGGMGAGGNKLFAGGVAPTIGTRHVPYVRPR